MHIIEKYNLSQENIDRIVEMAWEDRTPFEAIEFQFGLSENEVRALMQYEMHPNNWKKWRARVHGRATKHAAKRDSDILIFKSRMQKPGGNKISKKKYN